jgi:hypothetical protein
MGHLVHGRLQLVLFQFAAICLNMSVQLFSVRNLLTKDISSLHQGLKVQLFALFSVGCSYFEDLH